MSALNVTQDEADLLIASLNMYADVHKNASGVVPEDVKNLLAKLAPAPAAPVVEEPVVEETSDVVEPTEEEVVVEETSTKEE
jgi:hypothetical protein